jgi:hypothetical protein
MKELLAGGRGHSFPSRSFVPGTNAIGIIETVGAAGQHARIRWPTNGFPPPAQSLLGYPARFGEASQDVQADWIDGTFAQYAQWPASLVTPIGTLGDVPPTQALGLARVVVP